MHPSPLSHPASPPRPAPESWPSHRLSRGADSAGEAPDLPPHRLHPEWRDRFPWLVQGVTTRGWPDQDPAPQVGDGMTPERARGPEPRSLPGDHAKDKSDHDMRIWGEGPSGGVQSRWEGLRRLPGVRTVVHARQVHGAVVRVHHGLPPGLHRVGEADGHLTADPGILLAVTVADCVPVYLAGEQAGRRGIALLHAGWRGVVAGIVEAGICAFRVRLGIPAQALSMHLGPAIGGDAYEVGPEVHGALGLGAPPAPANLDLREVVRERARKAGVPAGQMTVSSICTRTDPFHYSHRGGDEGRQVAFLGLREEAG